MTIECTHPVRAHVLADYLRRHDVPALVVNEVDAVIGYCILPSAVFVPDSFGERVSQVLSEESPDLPEDPEYIYSDGVTPRQVGPLELERGAKQIMQDLGFVILAIAAFVGVMILGTLLEWLAY